jgi:ribose transport system permease protein
MKARMVSQTPPADSLEIEVPEEPPSALTRLWRALSRSWIFLFLIGLVVYFSLTTPNHAFFQGDNFKAIALDTSVVMLLAIGETFVIATAGIDLSIGGILLFSGVAGGLVMLELAGTEQQTANLQYPNDAVAVPVGIAVALACGVGWGLVNGLLVTRLRLPPFIVTLGTLGITFGAADLMSGGTNIVSVPTSLQDSVGNGKIFGLYVPVVIALVIAIAAHIVLRYTRFGRYTEAVGSNAEGARRSGIAVDRHLIKVYTLCGTLAGLAAVIDLARFGTMNLAAHNNDNLNAIAAVVIGGTSLFGGIATIFGTVVGAFIPTVLQNGLVISAVNPFWQQVVVGAMIIVAVYLDQVRRRRWSS